VKAPHALCFYSEEKDNYLLNAGVYYAATGTGFDYDGTRYLLGGREAKRLSLHGMQFVILVLFGESEECCTESPYPSLTEKIDDFTDIKGHGGILGLVRLLLPQ
jgi:hypothetical protein